MTMWWCLSVSSSRIGQTDKEEIRAVQKLSVEPVATGCVSWHAVGVLRNIVNGRTQPEARYLVKNNEL